jgi:hypothetical protein
MLHAPRSTPHAPCGHLSDGYPQNEKVTILIILIILIISQLGKREAVEKRKLSFLSFL